MCIRDRVYIFNYGDYIDPDVLKQFEEETGIEVVYDTYDTNEEMYPIIEAGSVRYDVVCPSDSVSYTHLDVYKRQGCRFTGADGFLYQQKSDRRTERNVSGSSSGQ